jgi:hypothetical protein
MRLVGWWKSDAGIGAFRADCGRKFLNTVGEPCAWFVVLDRMLFCRFWIGLLFSRRRRSDLRCVRRTHNEERFGFGGSSIHVMSMR